MTNREILTTAYALLEIPSDGLGITDDADTPVMLLAYNNTLSQIAEQYIPYTAEEEVTPVQGRIYYGSLGNTCYKVRGVYDKSQPLPYRLMYDYIKVDADGDLTVIYDYIPTAVGAEDLDANAPVAAKLSLRTLAYGVAAEFALIRGRYEESVEFEKKFVDGILAAARNNKLKLPERRFV